MKYQIYGKVVGSKYIGEVEADNEEEAIEKGWELDETCVCFCPQCSKECEDPEISDLIVEPEDEEDG
jgi:hypothetical protein